MIRTAGYKKKLAPNSNLKMITLVRGRNWLRRCGCMMGTTAVASRGGVRGGRKVDFRPIGIGDEVKKLQERWYSLCLAPRRERVMWKMVHIVLPPVVLPGECHVTKEVREKNPVGTTVRTQHPTSVGELRHILLPPQLPPSCDQPYFLGNHTSDRAHSHCKPSRAELIRLGKQICVMKWKHSHCMLNRAKPNRTEPDQACSLVDVCFYSPADDRFCCAIGLTSWS